MFSNSARIILPVNKRPAVLSQQTCPLSQVSAMQQQRTCAGLFRNWTVAVSRAHRASAHCLVRGSVHNTLLLARHVHSWRRAADETKAQCADEAVASEIASLYSRLEVNPGRCVFLSESGNENYFTNALILLVRPDCVVIVLPDLIENEFSQMNTLHAGV